LLLISKREERREGGREGGKDVPGRFAGVRGWVG
jgi:hypothetical protein